MTFDQAKRFKQAFRGDKIKFDDQEFDIRVVPGQGHDFQRYCDKYPGSGITDEAALDFSSDEQFQLMALRCQDSNVVYRKIG
jgi:hypothetical protein